MASNEAPAKPAVIRGALPSDHFLYDRCHDRTPRAAFRTILGLAEEAFRTRERIEQFLTDGHPLGATLKLMTPQEALAYLMGCTRIDAGSRPTGAHLSSALNESGKVEGVSRRTPVKIIQSISSQPKETAVPADVDFDEDDLLLLGSKPDLPS